MPRETRRHGGKEAYLDFHTPARGGGDGAAEVCRRRRVVTPQEGGTPRDKWPRGCSRSRTGVDPSLQMPVALNHQKRCHLVAVENRKTETVLLESRVKNLLGNEAYDEWYMFIIIASVAIQGECLRFG